MAESSLAVNPACVSSRKRKAPTPQNRPQRAIPGKEARHPTFALKLRLTLEWRGLTPPEAADEIGIARSTLWNWLHEESFPSYAVLARVAEALRVPIEFLWDHGIPIMLVDRTRTLDARAGQVQDA